MFDPSTRTIFDVRRVVGISNDWTCYQTSVSPDGRYVWMVGGDGSYLVNLTTFEAEFFPELSYVYVYWSPKSKFILIQTKNSTNDDIEFRILSISDNKMSSLPVNTLSESTHWWQPSDNTLVYPSKDKTALIFLDASTMLYQELPFKNQDSRYQISNLAWNPNGDKLIFITENHILWEVDYPSLENLEQIIASAYTIGGAQWSPDGNSIAFVSGSDIYIVDTTK